MARVAALAGLASVGWAGAAAGATFEVVATPTRNAIVMHGPVEREDVGRFDAAAARTDRRLPTVVTLSSNGGDVAAATAIGARIAVYGYSTYTPDNAICASSCGLIWLAGRARFASASSHIGLHAAYDPSTRMDAPEAKVWIEGYFKSVGVPVRFIDYVYARSLGQGLEWVTREEAARYGIDVTVTPSESAPETSVSTVFVDTTDEAAGDYARAGRRGLLAGLKARYDAFDAEPGLRAAFRCFAYEVAADDVDGRGATSEGRPVDGTFAAGAWEARVRALVQSLGYDDEAATKVINTWVRADNNTIAATR